MTEISITKVLDDSDSAHLLRFCLERGVDCFTVTALYASEVERLHIDETIFGPLAPFSMGVHRLEQTVRHFTAPDVTEEGEFSEAECWRFNPESLRLILGLCGGSLTSYAVGGPENWTFYRKGTLFLGIVSHEEHVFMRLREEEVEAFQRLGIS